LGAGYNNSIHGVHSQKKTNITGGSIFIGAMFFIGKKT
jgi:hypothetical protein